MCIHLITVTAGKWLKTLLFSAAVLALSASGAHVGAWNSASGDPGNGESTTRPAAGDTKPAGGADRPFDASITIPELFEKAREAFGMDNHDLAEQFYQEILIRQRSNVRAMLELANVYERSGKLEYARGLLVRSARLDPDNNTIRDRLRNVERLLAAVLTEEVDSLMAAGQYELAVPKLSLHLSFDPENPEVLYRRAVCYAKMGRPKEALEGVNNALRFDQKEQYFRLREAIVADMKVSETEVLVTEIKSLVRAGGDSGRNRALELLGEILRADPDHEWARAEFARLSNPENSGETPGTEEGKSGWQVVRAMVGKAAGIGRRAAGLAVEHIGELLLLFAVVLIFRSPLTRLISKAFRPRPLLSGRFPRFTLSEILILLNSESHSGVLHVKGDSCRGRIYVDKGEPCHCAVGNLYGVKAVHLLLQNTATGYFEFAESSMPVDRTVETPLSVILMENSHGGPQEAAMRRVRAEVKSQKRKSRMKELLESKPAE
jgi:tetratricopeptide (TPR) repeat protein